MNGIWPLPAVLPGLHFLTAYREYARDWCIRRSSAADSPGFYRCLPGNCAARLRWVGGSDVHDAWCWKWCAGNSLLMIVPWCFCIAPFQGLVCIGFPLRRASPAGIIFRPFRAQADFFSDWFCLMFLYCALSGLGLYLVFFYGCLLPPVLSFALSGLRLISLVIGSAWRFYLSPFQGLVYIWFSFRRASPAGIIFRPYRAQADFFSDWLCLMFLYFAPSGLGLYLVFF